jgi:hypothetical protein
MMDGERGMKKGLCSLFTSRSSRYTMKLGKEKENMKKEKRGCKDACTGKEADS